MSKNTANTQRIGEILSNTIEKTMKESLDRLEKKQAEIDNSIKSLQKAQVNYNSEKQENKELLNKINRSTKTALIQEIDELKNENKLLKEGNRNANKRKEQSEMTTMERELEFYKRTCLTLIQGAKNRMDATPNESEKKACKENGLKNASSLYEMRFLYEENPNNHLLKIPNKETNRIIVDSDLINLPIGCFKIDLLDN